MLLKNKWLFAVLGVVAVAALVILTLIACRDKTSPPETPELTVDEEALWGTAPEETLGVPVETPYMTFHYPEEWRGKVEARLSEADGCSVTAFRTELSGKSVELFSVALSPREEEGYLLGWLQMEDGGEIKVYTRMNELSPQDWTEEEITQLSAMQERVNDIIIQFYENEAFRPDR